MSSILSSRASRQIHYHLQSTGTLCVGAGLSERELTQVFPEGQDVLMPAVLLSIPSSYVEEMIVVIGRNIRRVTNEDLLLDCSKHFNNVKKLGLVVDTSAWNDAFADRLPSLHPSVRVFTLLVGNQKEPLFLLKYFANADSNELLTFELNGLDHQISVGGSHGTITIHSLLQTVAPLVDLDVGTTRTKVIFSPTILSVFRSVQVLMISGTLLSAQKIVQVLGSNDSGVPITSLDCDVPALESRAEVQAFFLSLRHHAPQLRTLRVTVDVLSLRGDDTTWMNAVLEVVHLHNLTALIIGHPLPLQLRNLDVKNIFISLPDAQIISLNPKPELGFGGDAPSICPSLDVLDIAAVHGGQNLHSLGLYLNPEGTRTGMYQPYAPRPHVKELELGTPNGLTSVARKMARDLFPEATLI